MNIKLLPKKNFIDGPQREHYNDAGADVASTIDVYIPSHSTAKIPLGYGLQLPDGMQAIVQPRSGMSSKGITTEIAPIDSGYTGEIHAIVSNLNSYPYQVRIGDRVGQLVIMPIVLATFTTDEQKSRGDNGFGSTGK